MQINNYVEIKINIGKDFKKMKNRCKNNFNKACYCQQAMLACLSLIHCFCPSTVLRIDNASP